VQGYGASQRAVAGAAAAALTVQSARVAVSKNTAAAQRKTAETPSRGNRKKQVDFNLSPSPLEEAAEGDYNSKEDLDYKFDVDLDDITLNTEGLSLISKESSIDIIPRHGKILDRFQQEDSSEEESDEEVLCLYVPRLKSQAQGDNMSFRVQ
jgi:hypothetical protein